MGYTPQIHGSKSGLIHLDVPLAILVTILTISNCPEMGKALKHTGTGCERNRHKSILQRTCNSAWTDVNCHQAINNPQWKGVVHQTNYQQVTMEGSSTPKVGSL